LTLRAPDVWSTADGERLRDILDGRPENCALVALILLDSPLHIASGLLSPWIDTNTGKLRRDDLEVKLLILSGEAAPRKLPPANTASVLFGEPALGDEKARHRGLRDARLTRHDLIPLLILASTEESPFALTLDEQALGRSFAKALAPYVELFGQPDGEGSVDFASDAKDILACLKRSPATLVGAVGSDRSILRVIGRLGFADQLRAPLAEAHRDDAAAIAAYERKIALCGEVFNLDAIVSECAALAPDLPLLRRHLSAALTMRRRRSDTPLSERHRVRIEPAWRRASKCLLSVKLHAPLNRIGREELDAVVGLLSGAADAFAEGVGEKAWVQHLIAGDAHAEATVGWAFGREVENIVSALADLPAAVARALFERLFAGRWRYFSALAQTELRTRFEAKVSTMPRLADRLLAAENADEFFAVIKGHTEMMALVDPDAEIESTITTLCLCLAARRATSPEDQDEIADLV